MKNVLAVLDRIGIEVDELRLTTQGRTAAFYDLYAGTGDDLHALETARKQIKAMGLIAKIEVGDNEGHPACRRAYLMVGSLWITPDEAEAIRGRVRKPVATKGA